MEKGNRGNSTMNVHWTETFKKDFDKALGKYPLSRNVTKDNVNSLPSIFQYGKIVMGFPQQPRKNRLPLSAYNIGKSGGLRLVSILQGSLYHPIKLYAKSAEYEENVIRKSIKKALDEILSELCEENKH